MHRSDRGVQAQLAAELTTRRDARLVQKLGGSIGVRWAQPGKYNRHRLLAGEVSIRVPDVSGTTACHISRVATRDYLSEIF